MNRTTGLLVLGIAVAALTGCSANKTTAPVAGNTEQTLVQQAIAAAPQVATDGMFDSGDAAPFSAHRSGGTLTGSPAEESPPGGAVEAAPDRRFWRTITADDVSFDYVLSDPGPDGRPRAALVTVHRHLIGNFHVYWTEQVTGTDGSVTTVPHTFTKPLDDSWVRQLWLIRLPRVDGVSREWHLVAASAAQVASADTPPHIESIRLQTGDQDVTFSDPAAAIRWANLWRVTAASPVTVTVTTDAADDVVVLMHAGGRLMLTPNGDNTYSGTWNTPALVGLKHLGVNALSHATLYDEAGGYHSSAWLFPYLNTGEALASAMQ